MILTDLSALQSVTLVERSQLTPVLDELALARTDFIDPAQAATLGKGIGATTLIVGDWAVVSGKFFLNARVVSVSTGEVRLAATAEGTLDDFVSVEKDLVEAVIAAIADAPSAAEKRKLLSGVPTESFAAFSSYALGLDAAARGQREEAEAAYAAALQRDPSFSDAQQALKSLAQSLAADAAARSTPVIEAWVAKLESALAATATQPFQSVDAVIAAQLYASLDQPCPAAKAWWGVYASQGFPAQLKLDYHALGARLEALGVAKPPTDAALPVRQRVPMQSAIGKSLRFDALFGPSYALVEPNGTDQLFDLVGRCGEQEATLRAWVKQIKGAGLATQRDRPTNPTLGDKLQLALALVRAHNGTLTSADQSALRELASRTAGQPEGAHIQQALDEVLREGQRAAEHERRLFGATEAGIAAAAQAAIAGEGLDQGRDVCRTIAANESQRASYWVSGREGAEARGHRSWDSHLESGALTWVLLNDTGCLKGSQARFKSSAALLAYLREGVKGVSPTDTRCPGQALNLQKMLVPEVVDQVGTYPNGEANWTWSVLAIWYGGIVSGGCAAP